MVQLQPTEGWRKKVHAHVSKFTIHTQLRVLTCYLTLTPTKIGNINSTETNYHHIQKWKMISRSSCASLTDLEEKAIGVLADSFTDDSFLQLQPELITNLALTCFHTRLNLWVTHKNMFQNILGEKTSGHFPEHFSLKTKPSTSDVPRPFSYSNITGSITGSSLKRKRDENLPSGNAICSVNEWILSRSFFALFSLFFIHVGVSNSSVVRAQEFESITKRNVHKKTCDNDHRSRQNSSNANDISQAVYVGCRVMLKADGREGVVVQEKGGGWRVIKFDSGEYRRYRPSDLCRIRFWPILTIHDNNDLNFLILFFLTLYYTSCSSTF